MNRFMIGGLSILLLSAIGAPTVEAAEEQQGLRISDVEQVSLTGAADLVTHGASSSAVGGMAVSDAPELGQVADSIYVDRSQSSFEFDMKPSPEAGPTEIHGNRSVNLLSQ